MTKRPDPIDVHVGRAVRRRREQLALTQSDLADAIGVSFQQVQKYESGANRLSCSALCRAALYLGRPVAHFFDGLPQAQNRIAA